MEYKDKRVAIVLDSNGKCKYVGKVRLVDNNEYNRLINESNQIDAEKLAKKRELQNEIKSLKEQVNELNAKIKLLMGEE